MPHKAVKVANTFLDLVERRSTTLTHLKLQKLVYYAHGWHLAINDTALVEEGIEAWKYGPVVAPLYHAFKEYGDGPILGKAIVIEFLRDMRKFQIQKPSFEPDDPTFQFIERVWDIHGQYTAIQLSNSTHAKGTPWAEIAERFEGNIPTHIRIPDELIKAHFKSQM